MIINAGGPIPELRKLWKNTFGDPDTYLDRFFDTAYSKDRCFCILDDQQVITMLYWFDAQWDNKKIAYLFAAATDIDHRGQGLCRKLMDYTHRFLQEQGYYGIVLSPAEPSLFQFYGKMGYKPFSPVDTFTCQAGTAPAKLKELTPTQYCLERRNHLPKSSVLQEGLTLDFLATYSEFWAGEDFLLCCAKEGNTLYVQELLGDSQLAAGIVAALNCTEGHFRTPGSHAPLAMYLPLTDNPTVPAYFGLPLD